MESQFQKELNERWDKELEDFINREPIPVWRPEYDKLKFPMMVVLWRKKVSARNSNYLIVAPIKSLGDYGGFIRTFKHHGWPIVTQIFDVPTWMLPIIEQSNRVKYWKMQNWEELSDIVSGFDKQFLIPLMQKQYPCPEVILKDKKGQFKMVL